MSSWQIPMATLRGYRFRVDCRQRESPYGLTLRRADTHEIQLASQGLSSVQPPIKLELPGITQVSFSSVAYYAGLIVGASFWGISSDFIGRRPAFNCTLLIAGIFLCAAGGALNFIAFSALWAVIGTAAGGNVPVDSMIFLEFVPGR